MYLDFILFCETLFGSLSNKVSYKMHPDLRLRCIKTIPTKVSPFSFCNFYILKIPSYIIYTSEIPAPKEAVLKFF